MAKVTKDANGNYTWEGEKCEIENITKTIVIFKTSDQKTILLTDENHKIISEIQVTMVDFYEPFLEVENYNT